jgi:2-polyprenyl-6-hydroxyphenyl methylase/3-demethylubiquinone-9 3-methyltransferase
VNVDPAEIEKFSALAHRWWDPEGDFRPLHDINPLRLEWIAGHAELAGAAVLDVGCGGGILAEAMARRGARVTGIDLSEKALSVARLHLQESRLDIRYEKSSVEDYAGAFDVITCLELLEHVPQPASVVAACARLVKPGGDLFFATLNRNPKSFLFAIVGAELLLGLVARGTHRYRRFVKPAELGRWGRENGLAPSALTGLHYHPLGRRYSLGGNTHVNYLMHLKAPARPA